MSIPSGNQPIDPVTSREGIVRAMTDATYAQQNYTFQAGDTSENMSGARDAAVKNAQDAANNLVNTTNQNAENMTIALGVAGGLSVLGACASTAFLCGDPASMSTGDAALGYIGQGLNITSQQITSITEGLSEANTTKVKGEMEIDTLSPQLTEDAARQAGSAMQKSTGEQQQTGAAIGNFINGFTQASQLRG